MGFDQQAKRIIGCFYPYLHYRLAFDAYRRLPADAKCLFAGNLKGEIELNLRIGRWFYGRYVQSLSSSHRRAHETGYRGGETIYVGDLNIVRRIVLQENVTGSENNWFYRRLTILDGSAEAPTGPTPV